MVCYQIVMMNCIFQRVIICYLTLAIVIFTCQTRLRSLHKYTNTQIHTHTHGISTDECRLAVLQIQLIQWKKQKTVRIGQPPNVPKLN